MCPIFSTLRRILKTQAQKLKAEEDMYFSVHYNYFEFKTQLINLYFTLEQVKNVIWIIYILLLQDFWFQTLFSIFDSVFWAQKRQKGQKRFFRQD